jgi:hypothetical protein
MEMHRACSNAESLQAKSSADQGMVRDVRALIACMDRWLEEELAEHAARRWSEPPSTVEDVQRTDERHEPARANAESDDARERAT